MVPMSPFQGNSTNGSVPHETPAGLRGRHIDPSVIITTAQLFHDTLELAASLPPDIDAVVAIARSGLIPGGLIASCLHLPLWCVSKVYGVVDPGHGGRMGLDFKPYQTEPRHILLIDDTAALGRDMSACTEMVKKHWPGAQITRAVIYCHPQAIRAVDVFHSLYPGQHFLEWNWPNAGHGEAMGFDFDGILCEECTPPNDDDNGQYRIHLQTAKPLYLPRRRQVPLIVSARHERYRELCTAWLARHQITVGLLMLRDFGYEPGRGHDEQVGEWKAAHYGLSACALFAESSPGQAHIIVQRTGKRVLCPALGRVLVPPPEPAATPPRRSCCG